MHDLDYYSKFNEIINVSKVLKIKRIHTSDSERFFKALNYCLNKLKDEYRMILENSYFECEYKFWWMDYYCKSSFYRKRYWAIVAFVRLFELIYENSNDFSSGFNFSL